MPGLILLILSTGLAYWLTVRSLAWGVCCALTVGYVHGVLRANLLDPATTFLFDGALFGVYAGAYMSRRLSAQAWKTPVGRWAGLLIIWPVLMTLVPINNLLIQVAALRGAVWYVVLMVVGSRLDVAEVKTIGRWTVGLNVLALAGGLYIYFFGLPSLYPENIVTLIAYKSRDVAGGFYRIPSLFLNAHAYGAAMIMSIPLVASIGLGRQTGADRVLAIIGAVAALAGILMCGARQTVVVACVATLLMIVVSRLNLQMIMLLLLVIGAGGYAALQNERLQRALTLTDTDYLQDRVAISVNTDFFDLLTDYPFGAGMGSAFGSSVPSFLAEYAPKQVVGLENEYSRIHVNQGVIGLLIWLAFIVWYATRVPGSQKGPLLPARQLAYSMTITIWMTAWIGAGMTSAIPSAAMMFLLHGMVVAPERRLPRPVVSATPPRPGLAGAAV